MAKLPRVNQKVFAESAGATERSKFGSLAAGTPETTTNVAEVQDYPQFVDGWWAAVIANNSPAIEDMNALFWLCFYQLAYQFQQGISEWDSATEYHIGSFVNDNGTILVSRKNTNLNNPTTDAEWWLPYRDSSQTKVLAGISTRKWTGFNAANSTDLFSNIAWSPELGLFCVVGTQAGGPPFNAIIQTSPDGLFWTNRTPALPQNITRGICWVGGVHQRFIAIGGTGASSSRVQSSADGTTWVDQGGSFAGGGMGSAMVYAEEIDTVVAMSQATDGSGRSAYSTDGGLTWTQSNSLTADVWSEVCWSPTVGLFVAVSVTNGTNKIATSPDGITWTRRTTAADQFYGVTWSEKLSKFVAAGLAGLYSSTDGITWTLGSVPYGSVAGPVVWAPELEIFAFGYTDLASSLMEVSATATGVTRRVECPATGQVGFQIPVTKMTWAPELGIFVGVSSAARNVLVSR